VSTCCDIEKNHLVSTLLIISDSQLDRVADVAQATLLRTAKLHPACYGAIVHIQAGNHSFGQHGNKNSRRFMPPGVTISFIWLLFKPGRQKRQKNADLKK
jgi:hypothetical protein